MHAAHTLVLKVVLVVLLGPVRKRWGRGLGSEGFDPPVSSSMAMKNRPFIGDFSIETTIHRQSSMAMFAYQRIVEVGMVGLDWLVWTQRT